MTDFSQLSLASHNLLNNFGYSSNADYFKIHRILSIDTQQFSELAQDVIFDGFSSTARGFTLNY